VDTVRYAGALRGYVTCVTMVCYVVLGWCVTVCGSRYVAGDGVRVTVGGITIRA